MKYLCLIYNDDEALNRLPQNELHGLIEEFFAFTRDIITSGHYLGCNQLEPGEAVTKVRVRNGKMSMTDGPFAETKEHLGGYYLVEARDLNEAIQVAARVPVARIGCIEVRPVREHPEFV